MRVTVAGKIPGVALVRLLPTLLVITLTACGKGRTGDSDERGEMFPTEETSGLTPELARAALIDMVEPSLGTGEIIAHALPDLKTEEAKWDRREEGVVTFGVRWRVDLRQRTFVLFMASELTILEYHGEFRATPSGGWEAEVTDIKEIYMEPPM